MAFTLIDSVIARGTNGNDVTTAAIDTTGANLIVIAGACGDPGSVITDSKGNTWTPLTEQTGTSDIKARLFYAFNPTVGSGHTFTNTQAGDWPSIAVAAYSGAATSPFDDENGTPGSVDPSVETGQVDPTTDGQLIVTSISHLVAINDQFSIDDGFTLLHQVELVSGQGLGLAFAHKIQVTAAAENPTWSWASGSGNAYPAVIATFKSGEAGGDTPTLALISPERQHRNATHDVVVEGVTFTGTLFDAGNGTVNSDHADVTLENIVVNSAVLITADIRIAAGSESITANLSIETDDGESAALPFSVLAPAGGSLRPTMRGRRTVN